MKRWTAGWLIVALAQVEFALPANSADEKPLPRGTRAGSNDWARSAYGGPCPPIGRHRYFFTLYALDTVLGDLERPARVALLDAMQDHVLATAELIGAYQRQ